MLHNVIVKLILNVTKCYCKTYMLTVKNIKINIMDIMDLITFCHFLNRTCPFGLKIKRLSSTREPVLVGISGVCPCKRLDLLLLVHSFCIFRTSHNVMDSIVSVMEATVCWIWACLIFLEFLESKDLRTFACSPVGSFLVM